MRNILIFSFLSLILFTTETYAAETQNECKLLGDNLYNCTPYECDTESDENKIHHRVIGLNEAGECVHEQVNKSGEKFLCKYSEESRKFLSLRMKKYGSALIKQDKYSQFEENILADIFENECEVESSNKQNSNPIIGEDVETDLDGDYNEYEDEENDQDDTQDQTEDENIEGNSDLLSDEGNKE